MPLLLKLCSRTFCITSESIGTYVVQVCTGIGVYMYVQVCAVMCKCVQVCGIMKMIAHRSGWQCSRLLNNILANFQKLLEIIFQELLNLEITFQKLLKLFNNLEITFQKSCCSTLCVNSVLKPAEW